MNSHALRLFIAVFVLPLRFSALFAADCGCSIGDHTPKEYSVACEDVYTVSVKAPVTCNNTVLGQASGEEVVHRMKNGDFPSSLPVPLVGWCAHGNELTKTVRVSIIPSDSADQTPGEAQTGQTGVSSPTEPRPRLLTGWPPPVSRAALPARHVPQGTPLWQVSLGGSPTGEFGGRLVLSPVRLFDPNPTPPDTSILSLLGGASSGLDIVHPVCDGRADTNRFVAIRSKTCYVGFSSPTGFPFTASFYHPQALEDDFDERGHYRLKTSAEPFVVYTFAFAETDETAQSYAVTESRAGLPDRRIVLTCREAGGETVYGLKEGDGARRSEVSQLPVSNGVRTVVKRYSGTAGVERTVLEEYKTLGDFDRLVREVQTDGTETRERLYTYCEEAQSPFFGLPLSERTPSGERIAYVYDDAKRIVRETRTAIGLPKRERVLSYEPLNVRAHCPDGMGGIDIADDNGSEEFSTPRIETQYVNGIAVSKTLRFISTDTMAHRIIEEVRLINPASGDISEEWENPANRRSYGDYKPKDGCRACSERPVLLKKPDGTIERYSYGSGDYTPGEDGSAGVFTPRSGGEAFRTVLTRYPAQPSIVQTNGAVTLAQIPYKTTREVTVEVRASKKVLLKEQYVCTGSGRDDFERISWQATTRDELGQEILVVSSDGARTEKTYVGNRLNTMRSADGSVVTYIYDSLSRVISETQNFSGIRPNSTTLSSYDLEGHILSRTISSDSLSEIETTEYDGFGRMAMSASSDGIITKYLYDTDAIAGLETKTAIRGFGTPCAITNETVSYVDGRMKETRLNGKLKSTYTYGTDENGDKWTKMYEGEKGAHSARWTLAKTNPLGQTIEEIRPGFGGTTLVTSNIYNSAGNLLASRLSDSQGKILNSSLFCYDSSGQRYLSVEDLNRNSIIDFTEADRVVSNDTRYVKLDGDWWRESSSWKTRENNSSALTRISCVRERLTGIGVNNLASEIKSFDIHGKLTTTRTYRDRNALTFTQITDTPDSIFDAKAISIAGLLSTNITASGIISDYTYDALGRKLSEADGRGNVTETCYDEKGRVVQTLDGAGNATTYTYDALGRQTSVTDPNGMTVTTAYDAEGHVISQRGATYPVDYTYDEFGNKTSMTTYRNGSSGSGVVLNAPQGDVTRWFYDEATGLVTNKVYADGKGPSYTYTPDGKLATRTWTRGVVTTYTYDNSGALTNTVYSDDTPTISMTYDRVGNMLSAVTDGVCTNLYAYSLTGLCTNEVQNGATIARSYDALGRSTGYTFQTSQNASVIQTLLSYDALGRIASITSGTNTFTYSYLPGTDIVDGYTCGNFSRKIEFEPLRNLVAAVTNSYANRVISAFDYTNDAAGRRTAISRSGEAFGDLSGAVDAYGYNARNEVISARRTKNGEIIHGFNEDFEYDPIGNRISSTTYNELGEPKTSQYSANNLNQYTSRTVPGYAAVRGHADADATVTVNEKTTYRYGEYFFGSDEFDNTSSPVNAALETVAVKPGATEDEPDEIASVTNSVYLAKSPVEYEYDDDGNQTLVTTKTGTWRVTYNGENRPVLWERVATDSNTLISNTQTRVSMSFDHQGRRRMYLETAADGSTNCLDRFTYDNYLCIARNRWQPDGTSATDRFVWDPTEPIATRPLAFYQPNAPPQFYAIDGNKNVSELVASADGSISAHYEYAPFGEVILSSGDFALTNPFCFSSEYVDDLLALVYYNYRHYNSMVGRWMSRDAEESVSSYSFLYNDCSNDVDMLGRVSFCESFADVQRKYYQVKKAYNDFKNCLSTLKQWSAGMKEKTNGLTNDKLFHCWASCEIGNDCSEAFSIFLGVLKEFGDRLSAYSNVFDLDEFKKTIRDSEEDEEADMMGIECKKRGGDCKCCCAEFYDTF